MLRSRKGIWWLCAVVVLACAPAAIAQQSAPDAPQPQLPSQSSSKPAPAAQPAAPTDAAPPAPLQSPPRSDAPAATEPAKKPDPKDFPFPDATDNSAKPDAQGKQPAAGEKPPGKNDFPFPEETDKPAAAPKDAAAPPKAAPPPPLPGYSSSSSSSSLHDEGSDGAIGGVVDLKRAEQDKEIARFYWNRWNYEGAYLRFKDAVVYAPQNPDMWFGLAESERMLGKNVKAREHYKKYLELAPDGGKAKDSAKMLQTLPDKDKVVPPGPGPRVP
jgi:hypothetical protein